MRSGIYFYSSNSCVIYSLRSKDLKLKEKEKMNYKCTKCGSANVVEGKLSTGTGGLVFTTQKSQKKLPLTQKYSTLVAKGCKECGAVFDIRMENPQAIDENK